MSAMSAPFSSARCVRISCTRGFRIPRAAGPEHGLCLDRFPTRSDSTRKPTNPLGDRYWLEGGRYPGDCGGIDQDFWGKLAPEFLWCRPSVVPRAGRDGDSGLVQCCLCVPQGLRCALLSRKARCLCPGRFSGDLCCEITHDQFSLRPVRPALMTQVKQEHPTVSSLDLTCSPTSGKRAWTPRRGSAHPATPT